MLHRQSSAAFIIHRQRTDPAAGQVAAYDHDGHVILFNVRQQVGFFKDPACDHDDRFGPALENHVQVAVEELALRLRVHEQWNIAGRLQGRLDAAHDESAEWVGEIESEYADGLAMPAAQRAGVGVGMIAELPRHRADLLAGGRGNVLRERRLAQDDGDRGDGEAAGPGNVQQGYVT
jgi:hypothetical protein